MVRGWIANSADLERFAPPAGRSVATRRGFHPAAYPDLAERVFHSLPCGVLIIDRRGRITGVNPRTCEMFGVAERDLTGKDSGEVLKTDDPNWYSLDPIDRLGDPEAGRIVEGRINGRKVRFAVELSPCLDDCGEPAGTLPPGRRAEDYHQVLAMADAEWSYAHLTLRAEGYSNAWETPTVGDLRVKGFYVEGKYTLPAGLYVAGRHEIMRFSDLTDSLGAARPWDADWDRTEAGLGYRITRGAIAKLVYQTNLRRADPAGEPSRRHDLVAGQLTLRF